MILLIGLIVVVLMVLVGNSVSNHFYAKASNGNYGRYCYKASEMGLGGTPFQSPE